jgi:hypothetical protein
MYTISLKLEHKSTQWSNTDVEQETMTSLNLDVSDFEISDKRDRVDNSPSKYGSNSGNIDKRKVGKVTGLNYIYYSFEREVRVSELFS